jgi:hypothetical protein
VKFLTGRLIAPSNTGNASIKPSWLKVRQHIDGFIRSIDAHFDSPSQVWSAGRERQIWWSCILPGGTSPALATASPQVAELAAAHGITLLSLGENEVDVERSLFHKPIIILAAPRSGSTLLHELLSQCRSIWTLKDESSVIIDEIPRLSAQHRGFESNALGAEDADVQTSRELLSRFVGLLRSADDAWYPEIPPDRRPVTVRFLEKTPRNAYRVPFLRALFPDARFIFLYRDPRENIGSIIDAWQSRSFVSYPELPGWDGPAWSLLLPPGWRSLRGRPVEHIAAYQWSETNKHIMNQLSLLPRESWCVVRHDHLLSHPTEVVKRLCRFAEVAWDERLAEVCAKDLPLSGVVLTPPKPDKWRKHAALIEDAMRNIQPAVEALEEFTQTSARVEW